MSGRARSRGRARRRPDLSQHFLKSSGTARRLVDLARIGNDDLVVEAGPGRGALTRHLSDVASQVIAIESDRHLLRDLDALLGDRTNVTLRHGDFMTASLPSGPYRFFANIPFSRTADIVRKLTLGKRPPEDAFLVMEAAAATRFLGLPFGPESALSLALKVRFHLSVIAWLGPNSFSPPPSVDSVMVRFARRTPPLLRDSALARFDRFAKSIFRSSRPYTRRSLRSMLDRPQANSLIDQLGFPASAAPSNIPFDEWLTVFNLSEWNRAK